ncbi:hypothetical protein ASG22_09125 [Chryseobacterium sp. Leaf405]|uniref:hypothetical protein n=1 Tax=Chryseobacterium sp. Leaf405 TaxID=1736367 RepID=UPI0006FE3A98|nr:hypothetical protein [Chryseobacterium sp. Leaf405]KQT24167.1 hypothetical protein ASG22_09125 [Chryseobacterium sp. Leaf405]
MEKPAFVRIPKGSTLDEMSRLFEVDKDYLKRHHNIYCEYNDLIEKEFPKHLVKLFVPTKNKEYETSLISGGEMIIFFPEDILVKNKLFHKKYGIRQILHENGTEKTKMSFMMEVEKVAKSGYSIVRNNIYINNRAPDLVTEQMVEKVGNIFFPLEVETLENGNLKQITNIDEIRKRWKILQSEISKYYQGRTAEKIIETINDELADKNMIQNRILGSLFYRLYFLPFRDYISDQENEFDLYLPLFPFKNKVKYQVMMSKKPVFSETGKMILEIKGKLTDIRNFNEMVNGTKALEPEEDRIIQCDGSINALYQFNKEDGSVFSLEAEIILTNDDNSKSRKIIFELYQQ